jgi:omega-amidase
VGRVVDVSVVQPIGGDFFISTSEASMKLSDANSRVKSSCLEILEDSLKNRTDIVCLPELCNVFALPASSCVEYAEQFKEDVFFLRIREYAKKYKSYIISSMMTVHPETCESGKYYNTNFVIGRDGEIEGYYFKTHLTYEEINNLKLCPGETYPIFDLDFGKIAIAVCMDIVFPEPAMIFGLKGAEILFHPRWQSGPSEIVQDTRVRARAIDSLFYIASSSYGIEPDKAWRPGMLFGRSRIMDPEGLVLADTGRYAGYVKRSIDLDKKYYMDVLDAGGDIRELKKLNMEIRRPETYSFLAGRGKE